jgi:hypothetical protein
VPCVYCKQPVPEGRVELGMNYCMSNSCVRAHHDDWQAGYRYILVPKQGYMLVRADSPHIKSGKSSGRT